MKFYSKFHEEVKKTSTEIKIEVEIIVLAFTGDVFNTC